MLTLRQLFELFDRFNRTARAPRTAEFYREQFARVLQDLGDLEAGQLRPHHFIGYRPTWHFVLAVQRLFRWAADEMKILEVNHFTTMKRPRLGRRRRVLSRPELAILLRLARPDFRRVLLAATEAAARPQEIVALAWEHLCWPGPVQALPKALTNGTAYFQLDQFKGLNRREDQTAVRLIPITPRLGRLLWRLARGRHLTGPIFRTVDGRPWNRNSLGLRMRRLIRKAAGRLRPGREKVCCYTLRHTGATRWAAKGLEAPVLSELLGHSDLQTTQRYCHLSRAQVMQAWAQVQGQRKGGWPSKGGSNPTSGRSDNGNE